jgi:signal transduction histidine kinase
LLLPLLAVALLASVAVAIGSYMLGDRWARDEVASRYQGIEATLSQAAFPLNRQVVTSIAELTDTELITLDASGVVAASSINLPSGKQFPELAVESHNAAEVQLLTIQDDVFRFSIFSRRAGVNDTATKVAVLFDEADLRSSRLRAAILPLASGLSTVILLTSVTLVFASRLIRRLSRLQQQVNRIAEGDFETTVPIGVKDEVGMLGTAVSQMSAQLHNMWTTLQRQQGQKLLHQIAGGLAHQLRNSITGARMAVELHQKDCRQADDTLAVALGQLEQTEAQIRRLLQVAAGRQDEDHQQAVGQCIDDIRSTLSSTAKHLGVELNWQFDDQLRDDQIADGPSLSSAISNLVLNALQEAKRVNVSIARHQNNQLQIDVVDDGVGPPDQVADEIFEPFVTSKPEGLGLGLPLVARSAQRLGGKVEWKREGDQTRFTMTVHLHPGGAGQGSNLLKSDS